MLVSLSAFAGKTERDYMTNEVQPAVKAAKDKLKSACGCTVNFTVSDSLKTTDDMAQARNIANAVTEGAPAYCSDAASKKAVCKLKTIEVVKGKETGFAFKGDKGTCTTDGQSYVSWDMITREIDK
ncbi:MAG TPA: hypothetical protein VH165_01095 [Kofleriaceae bacterium]|jgi:hypothetical protein|nr:hypothetical protein [Kofleriaceae bacterium]